PRLRLRLGVEVGKDVTAEELAARHDAVVYAVGAASAKRLGVPGEDLPGSVAATTVVAWYNGHPDVADDAVDLSSERVVLVGGGNVALDVARILTADPKTLEGTSIAPRALERLRSSSVREVVVLARRGPDEVACSRSELLALVERSDAAVVVDVRDERTARTISAGLTEKAVVLQRVALEEVDWSAPPPPGRRVVFRFHSAPVAVLGDTGVRGLRVTGPADDVEIGTGQVVRAVGYRGIPVPGLPFDEATGTVPHSGGRVADRPGTYVVGWIKRGSTGGIGANKTCAAETVDALVADAVNGRLPARRTTLLSRLRRRS
ncbi:MAG TPA: FAD-dependent oxidoreductase, partial [Umezawaea sp.]|nr:FAD-dependent oxidoreductase [Umezawaea sp.]